MPRFIDDEALRLAFAVHQQPGVYALLLGSGLSSAAGIPTGWAITIDLIRRVGALRGETAERTDAEWEAWYRAQTGRAPDYSELLAELGPRPAERQPIIASYIEPTEADRAEGRKLPTEAHKAIAQLVAGGSIRIVLTTNFDRLLENALREVSVEPIVIASPDQCHGAKPLQHVPAGSCMVIKLHGDYLDVRSLNTAEELATYDPAIATLLARVFDEYGLVICGWSGVWDTALRDAMLRAPGRRYSTWWASLGPLATPAQDLARHRDAQLVTIDGADGFFKRLADNVDVIATLKPSPPISVDLMVALAKRYLAKAEHRIELADLVKSERSRIVMTRLGVSFAGSRPYDRVLFRTIIHRYENLCEPMAALLVTIGRWGDTTSEDACLETITELAIPAPHAADQDVKFQHITSYPAVLCFMAYGLGLIKAKRWDALWRLYQHEIPHINERKRLVELLFLEAWPKAYHGKAVYFAEIEGLESRRLPLSRHLRNISQRWGRHLSGPAEREHLLDQFEFNGSMAYARPIGTGTLREFQEKPFLSYVWFPVGELAFEERRAQQLIEAANRAAAEGGGFAPGDVNWVAEFTGAYREMLLKVRQP